MGWLGHDACHHGLTPWRKVNNFAAYIFGNVCNGFSVNWWKNRHNTHHAITNVLDSDPDVDNLPLFVWSKFDLHRITKPDTPKMAESIIPYQHLYFVPWTLTLKLIWDIQSLFFIRHAESHNKSFRNAMKFEIICVVLHYGILSALLWMTPSFFAGLIFYLISEFIGGSATALIVFMNHYACEQLKKVEGKDADFLTLQLATTKNVNPGPFIDWFAGGLNYQIEHHLFPTIPRHNLPKIKPLVEEFCKQYNLPYVSQSYSECLSAVEVRLAQVAEEYTKTTQP